MSRHRPVATLAAMDRELHDVVAHHIAVVSVHAGAASHVLRQDPEQVWPVLQRIRDEADTTLHEIQSVVGLLRDPHEVEGTEPVPGLDRLPDLIAGLGFPVTYRQTGTPVPLLALGDLAAYRIVQEALTNAYRHGDGEATLTIGFRPGTMTIDVVNRMPSVDGIEATRRICADDGLAGVHVLVLTTFENDDNVALALQATSFPRHPGGAWTRSRTPPRDLPVPRHGGQRRPTAQNSARPGPPAERVPRPGHDGRARIRRHPARRVVEDLAGTGCRRTC